MELLFECFIWIIKNIICHISMWNLVNLKILRKAKFWLAKFPNNKQKLVDAWLEIHRDELMADWKLAIEGQNIFKIEGLK